MRKLNSLKAHMTEALTHRGMRQNPADLHFAIPSGSVVARGRPGLGFEYRYTMVMAVMDCAYGLDEITVPLMMWIARWQPELLSLTAADGGIDWEVELLDDGKSDIMFRIPLTEGLHLRPRLDGGHDLVRPEEPVPFTLEQAAPLHRVFLDGELIASCSAHPDA
ncbi:phage tail protein [Brevundimonas diminuta]|uniref:phage tail protein n=1 Tax=Brevundimonas diminuta TaxID=293 RepID=UPI001903D46B|nr:phage tail protein [Brevundimonas diminuta]MBK1970818.1 phage tail protein [Brevundimonas diminuta]MBK1974793.1 phage tail protein [Brevundimonas diminuta]